MRRGTDHEERSRGEGKVSRNRPYIVCGVREDDVLVCGAVYEGGVSNCHGRTPPMERGCCDM
jgi:hypothetical protein